MITLLIPTLNRSSFVIRYLRYLQDTHFRGSVCIGDSSDAWHLDRTTRAIKGLKSGFEVIHRQYPGLKIAECIREMLPLISTPFAMYICDDDLLVPNTLEHCLQFLIQNPDYSAASGLVMQCGIRAEETGNKIEWIVEGPLYEIENDSASQRLVDLFSNYTVIAYSVARTEQFKERWPLDPNFSDIKFSAELMPCGMLAVQGKCKKLDRLFVVRQIHEERYVMPDVFDWLTSPKWAYSYQVFADGLARELARQDGIAFDSAREVVKQAFWSYLAKILIYKWDGRYGKTSKAGKDDHLRRLVRAVPGARAIWRALRSFNSVGRHELSLPVLLQPSSPYHADFMPAYRAITALL